MAHTHTHTHLHTSWLIVVKTSRHKYYVKDGGWSHSESFGIFQILSWSLRFFLIRFSCLFENRAESPQISYFIKYKMTHFYQISKIRWVLVLDIKSRLITQTAVFGFFNRNRRKILHATYDVNLEYMYDGFWFSDLNSDF